MLPTTGAVSSYAGDVEVVQPDAAAATIAQFLGGPFGTIITPPIDAYGNPMTLTPPAPTTTTAPAATTTHPAGSPPRVGPDESHRLLGSVLRPHAVLTPAPRAPVASRTARKVGQAARSERMTRLAP